MSDLERDDIRWDVDAALRVIGFFADVCCLAGGKFEGSPFILDPWQAFCVGSIFGWRWLDGRRRFRTAYIETAKGSGKSPLAAGVGHYMLCADGESRPEIYAAAPLALDTPVPTPTGWTTQGELQVGDQVFDELGQPCEVTYLSPILHNRPCFEIEFDDGTRIVSDANHRWQTEDTRGQKPGLYPPAVVTTAQIAQTLRSPSGRLRHRIPVAGSLELPPVDLPIDPYVLGVWLGDGRSNRGLICCHVDDAHPVEACGRAGYEISLTASQGDVRYFTVRGLRTQLRVNGLLDNKHVPTAYLRASEAQRFALLRGLMDTDATCTKTGECRFTNRNRSLAAAVHELATGLGLRAGLREISVTGAPHYVVSFKAATDRSAFSIERKANRQRQKIDTRAEARYVRSVKLTRSVPVRCIEVSSPSHLYLVSRSNIATHNTKKDQAMVLFRDAVAMYQQSPLLKKRLTPSGGNFKTIWQLTYLAISGWFKAISNDDGQSGPRPYCALVDEVHEHKDESTIEMLEAGFKFRDNPLLFMITNSGHDLQSTCGKYHTLAEKVCAGEVVDDEFFAYVCALDDGEDPFTDEACWIKANPSLGVTIQPHYLRTRISRARNLPSKRNEVLRLNFCVWTDAEAAWMTKPVWAAVQEPELDLDRYARKRCVLGLDMAIRNDLNALVGLIEDEPNALGEPCFAGFAEFWLPKEKLREKADEDGVDYPTWAEQGFLGLSEGNFVRQEFIAARLVEISQTYDLVGIGYDEYAVKWLIVELDRLGVKLPLIEHPQGFRRGRRPDNEKKPRPGDPPAKPGLWMPGSIGLTEQLVIDKRLRMKPNPILTWNVASATFERDAQGNRTLSKRKATGRIDGAVALVMASGVALNAPDGKSGESYLETGEVVFG